MVNALSELQQLRKAKGISTKELAQQIGIATSAIWSYENGMKKIPKDHAERLAGYFDVTVETLLRD